MKAIIVALVVLPSLLLAETNVAQTRLDQAANVFSAVMATPDRGIPQSLLNKAYCVIVVPDLKTMAFLLGGEYGKGYMSCRNKSGSGWSAPAAIRIEGVSAGLQVGGSSTDLIMLVMNDRGMDKVLSSRFTIGAEGSIAAGPVGRTVTAQTDAQLRADILSWSRSQGLFAGVALAGATLRENLEDNAFLYGKSLSNREIVTKKITAPSAAAKLMALLEEYSTRK
ncbi:MAG TPA: lipid-binding SYLF domain-containing protein [Candidatus Binataceae bacterium]|nr:lipid-binding SYLF domain-containing protein [Candidatus Binataceae bacterium]